MATGDVTIRCHLCGKGVNLNVCDDYDEYVKIMNTWSRMEITYRDEIDYIRKTEITFCPLCQNKLWYMRKKRAD